MKRRKLKKLLVANRGEIALRIIRSARLYGLKTVAVYSAADAGAAHVAAADEARAIGPAEAARSYLSIAAIIGAARAVGADAIHPGYGFLSERPEFARAAAENGLTFIGPPPEVMASLGDKVSARRTAMSSGVPVVPGIETAEAHAARQFAARHGFPILIKAAAGGGGRGMRVVEAEDQLDAALEAAAREAAAAFGDGRIFAEKYLARPRHVEVQILGDEDGGVIALGERDCSIQRRHQKLIEESPAPGLSGAARARIIEAALKLARAAGYRNAGTVEFLVDGDEFYFLEVNARLQVEHPVTEERFGCDLVCEQLRVAEGERVGETPEQQAHAIECRVYAEDAEHDFRPATGAIEYLNLPAGPGVRVDTHLARGAAVTSYYDGMLAKIICRGEHREQARARMAAALGEFTLLGVTHNGAFLRDVINSSSFAQARLSTRFIPEFFPDWHPERSALRNALMAAALAAAGILNDSRAAGQSRQSFGANPSPWESLRAFRLWEPR